MNDDRSSAPRNAVNPPYLHSWTGAHFGRLLREFGDHWHRRRCPGAGRTAGPGRSID